MKHKNTVNPYNLTSWIQQIYGIFRAWLKQGFPAEYFYMFDDILTEPSQFILLLNTVIKIDFEYFSVKGSVSLNITYDWNSDLLLIIWWWCAWFQISSLTLLF